MEENYAVHSAEPRKLTYAEAVNFYNRLLEMGLNENPRINFIANGIAKNEIDPNEPFLMPKRTLRKLGKLSLPK